MNAQQNPKKSQVGVELVRLLAAEGDRVFTVGRARELSPRAGVNDSYLWEALHHLGRNGWIVSLRRWLYALSGAVPGVTPAHEFEVAMALATPAAISHWSALHHHGLTEQVPRKVFVLTTTEATVPRPQRGKSKDGYLVGDAVYQFIQVKPERYFGTEEVWVNEARVTVTDPERTLVDGLSRPNYCGDFAEVLHAFAARGDDLRLERIIEYALRVDAATVKRLGWVLENQGIEMDRLTLLKEEPIKGYRHLDPTGPHRGPCNKRWMIQVNLPGRVKP